MAPLRRLAPPAALLAALLLLAGCGPLKRCAYSGFGRDGWQQPERVVEALGLEPGDRVADLGAGGGYFTWYLAEAVGPAGAVYAVDVDEAMLEHLRDEAAERGLAQVETVRAAYDDPRIPEPGVDLVFTSNTYHHLSDRSAYFRRVREDLRPGGRVAVVEFQRKGWFQRLFDHATEPETIRAEMEAAGYRRVADHDFLSRQSFQVFAPADAPEALPTMAR